MKNKVSSQSSPVLCALLLLSALRLAAQTPLPDSLHLSGTMADTAVAIRLINESSVEMFSAPRELVLAKLDQVRAISTYTVGEESFLFARYLHYIGYTHMGKGESEIAQRFYQRALQTYQNTVGDNWSTANVLHQMGANYFYVAHNPDEAIPYFRQSTEMADRLNIPSQSWQGLAGAYQEKGDDREALHSEEEQLKRAKKFLDSTDIALSICYQQVSGACSNIGDFDRALEYEHDALRIARKSLPDTDPFVAQLFGEIGYYYNETGDFDRALEYYQKALASQQAASDTTGITSSLSEMGRAYTSKGDYDRAVSVFAQAQKFVDRYHTELETSGFHLYFGQALNAQGKKQEALEQFHKGLDIQVKLEGEPLFNLLAPLLGIAGIHTLAGEYQAALPFYQRIMGILESLPNAEHPYMAIAFNDYADFFQRQGQFEQADSPYQLAWRYFRYVGTDSLPQVHGLNHLLPCIYGRGNFYRLWYQHTGRPELLDRSLHTFEAFDEAVRYQRLRLSEGSKTALSQTALPGYEGAIASNLLYWNESGDATALRRAFDFSEKAHSLQLFEALREAEALQFAGIPDSLLQREHDLNVDLAFWEKRRNEFVFDQKKPETDTAVLTLNSRISKLRRQYETLQSQFEREYPDYFQLRYDLSTASAAYVQDTLLASDQTLLEYFVGDSSIYLFVLRKDTILALEIKRDFPLDSLVAQMREGLQGGQYESSDPRYRPAVDRYVAAAQELYLRLVAPIRGLLSKRLVIVPDGGLASLPFEALLSAPPPEVASRFAQYPYFLRQHAIGYCYSATLLREMQAGRAPRGTDFSKKMALLAMAPFNETGYAALPSQTRKVVNPKEMSVLPATGKEVLAINQIWGGKGTVLLDRKATKAVFEKTAAQYRILHLATHGNADYRSGDYSYLAFADQKDTLALLHVRDIYNLSIRAELVVLSACETGVGKFRRGEGVVSLARAFSYAGAKSLVTTLWPTSDEGSKNLMIEFHRQLKAGQSKDVALQKAKSHLLNDLYTSHPFYWAGFVMIGDETSLGL